VLLAAVVGKFGGCMLAARANGLPLRESSIIGVMMNTRALMELIVINIGYDLGIIPKTVFFMLVVMAVVTTYMTTPILRKLMRHSEVWESYRVSAFAARFEMKG
jgi:Kef-type K+ transport system membrane component KefB